MARNTPKATFKKWWRSKLVWLGNMLVVSSPILEYARDNSELMAEYIGKATSAVTFGLGMAIVWMRKNTSTAISKKRAVEDPHEE